MLNIDSVTAQRLRSLVLSRETEQDWNEVGWELTEAILEARKEQRQSILGECWDRVACRSEEAAAIYNM